jgi:DNA-binding NarL/FixJ family response regulator
MVDSVREEDGECRKDGHDYPDAGTERRIRVLLVDDHALVRAGMVRLIESDPQCTVVAEASNGERALVLARELQPDIVFLDITMLGMNGLEACERIVTEVPETKVIMLSMHDNRQLVARALSVGASGYVVKDAAPEELKLAVTWVLSGNKFFSRQLAIQPKVAQGLGGASSALSVREREVLTLITEGQSTQEIATRLGLTPETVETCRAEIMSKFDIFNIAGPDTLCDAPRFGSAK